MSLRRGFIPAAAFWGTLAIGLLLTFYPTLVSGFRLMQHDLGDSVFCNYVLEHGYRWLTGQTSHRSFWDAPFFYPASNVLAYSETLVGSAPLYWIWRFPGFEPETAFQLWMLSVSAVNFAAMHAFLRRFVGAGAVAAAAGAFLFAFASSRSEQLVHQQLLPGFFSVGLLYSWFAAAQAWRENRGRARRLWIAVGTGCVVGGLYAGFYMGWFTVLAAAVGLGVAIVRPAARQQLSKALRQDWFWITQCILASVLALLPMAYHYWEAAQTVGVRALSEIKEAKIQSWLYVGHTSWLYFWQEKVRGFQVISDVEQRIGIGWLTAGLAGWGLWRAARRDHRLAHVAWIAVVLVLVTTRWFGPLYLWPFLFKWIPGAQAIRALSRIGVFLLPVAAIGLAEAFAVKRRRGVTIALLAAVVLEQGRLQLHFDKIEWRDRTIGIAARVPARGCDAFHYLPPGGESSIESELDAMWAGLRLAQSGRPEIPTLNGYSGNIPPDPLDLAHLGPWARRKGLDPARLCLLR